MQTRIARIALNVLAGNLVNNEDAAFLSSVQGDDLYDLFYWANKIRVQFLGRDITFCAIVPAKIGGCSEDCKFCAQSSHYKTAVGPQSIMSDGDVLKSVDHARAVGADSFGIVNSGRAPTRRELEDWLQPLIQKIVPDGKSHLCADLGALTPQTAQFLYDCGIRRVNHNLETSRRHYPNIVTTHPYEERIRTLKIAKSIGLELCSGGIFGMGENWDDRIDMALTLRDLDPTVVPINFLNPIPGTPLGNLPKLPPMECLKIISIYRFLLPKQQLKVAGGREVCLRDLQSWIFFAGASSMIIGNYLSTYGRPPEIDQQMITDLGMTWRQHETQHESGRGVPSPSSPPKLGITCEREFTVPAPNSTPH